MGNFLIDSNIEFKDGSGNVQDLMTQLEKIGNGGFQTIASSTRPASPQTGILYFESDTSKFVYYDGTQWVPVSVSAGGATALSGLSDVDFVTSVPANNEVLTYENGKWVPKASATIPDHYVSADDYSLTSNESMSLTYPYPVTNLTFTDSTTSSVSLDWTASKSTNISSYMISNDTAQVGITANTNYTASSLANTTNYTFIIRAQDTNNAVSDPVSIAVKTLGLYAISLDHAKSEYIQIPKITFDAFEFAAILNPQDNTWNNYFFQFADIAGGMTFQFNGTQAYPTGPINGIYINGVKQTGNLSSAAGATIPNGKKTTYKFTTSTPVTTGINLFGSSAAGNFMSAVISDIRFYAPDELLNDVVVSRYTFSYQGISGSVPDMYNRNPSIILHGGTSVLY